MKTNIRPRSKKYKTHFVAYVASSIDGRISLSDRVMPDWTSKEDWKFFQNKMKSADAVVAGMNTYIAARDHIKKRNAFIFSSHKSKIKKDGNVTFLNPSTVNLREIFSKYKTVAIVGGGQVYQTMLDEDMLDDLYVTIEPVIFGRGKEMFKGGTRMSHFKLQSVKKLNSSGTLLIHYKKVFK